MIDGGVTMEKKFIFSITSIKNSLLETGLNIDFSTYEENFVFLLI